MKRRVSAGGNIPIVAVGLSLVLIATCVQQQQPASSAAHARVTATQTTGTAEGKPTASTPPVVNTSDGGSLSASDVASEPTVAANPFDDSTCQDSTRSVRDVNGILRFELAADWLQVQEGAWAEYHLEGSEHTARITVQHGMARCMALPCPAPSEDALKRELADARRFVDIRYTPSGNVVEHAERRGQLRLDSTWSIDGTLAANFYEDARSGIAQYWTHVDLGVMGADVILRAPTALALRAKCDYLRMLATLDSPALLVPLGPEP